MAECKRSTVCTRPPMAAISGPKVGRCQPTLAVSNCLPLDQSTYHFLWVATLPTRTPSSSGFIGLYRSTDGGTTWSYTLDKAHPDFHAVVADNGVIYALNDGGLSISTNGTNWTQTANNGLATLQFTGASLGPQTDAAIYGGMQDNDSAIFSGSPNWLWETPLPTAGHTAFAPAGGVIFGSTQMANLLRSTTAQPDLNQVITPPLDMDIGETTLFYAPFESDPSNGDRLLYGTHRIWKSCRPDGTQCNATSGGPTDQAQVPQVNWSAGPALNQAAHSQPRRVRCRAAWSPTYVWRYQSGRYVCGNRCQWNHRPLCLGID